MLKLKTLLGLLNSWYGDPALVEVFDEDRVSVESDCLADDVQGFAFAVVVGESADFLTPKYLEAEVKDIYIRSGNALKVLVELPKQ